MASPLLESVRHALAEMPAAAAGVVALSGGPDSVALLRAVLAVRGDVGLVVAHVNHQLRGAESDEDEAFVRRLHQQWARAAQLRIERLHTLTLAAGDNLESAARRLRYEWLAAVAREAGAAWVATGHNADDQAETVLHRLLRGTGLRGLAGIPASRELAPGIVLLRPLLLVRRAEVLGYLEGLGQEARQDSSNAERRFTRNRLRHELLPLLAKEYNPAIAEVLVRLSVQAGEVDRYLETQAQQALTAAELPRAGAAVVLEAQRLNALHPLLVREVLRLLWRREDWPLQDLDFATWERIAAVVRGEVTAVDLPGGLRARRVRQVILIQR